MTLWEKAWPILLVFGVLILIFVLLPTKAAVSIVSFCHLGLVFAPLQGKAAKKMQKGICCTNQQIPFLFCNRYPG